MKIKQKREPLTIVLSTRVDVRKFAALVQTWEMRNIPIIDISSILRRLLHNYVEALKPNLDPQGQVLYESTDQAEAYLVSRRILKQRKDGNYTGQDKSTVYSKGIQLEKEEFSFVNSLDFKSEINKNLHSETTERNLKIFNGTLCPGCGEDIVETEFDNDEEAKKYWEKNNRGVCYNCIKKGQ